LGQPEGTGKIVDVSEERVTLDGNHPLAGHKLMVDLELVDIE
jgi:FKBP-type peptidyl-prolyl cis-trans isomerase 2